MASQVDCMNWYLPRNRPPPPMERGLPRDSHHAMRSSTAREGPPGTAGQRPPRGVPAVVPPGAVARARCRARAASRASRRVSWARAARRARARRAGPVRARRGARRRAPFAPPPHPGHRRPRGPPVPVVPAARPQRAGRPAGAPPGGRPPVPRAPRPRAHRPARPGRSPTPARPPAGRRTPGGRGRAAAWPAPPGRRAAPGCGPAAAAWPTAGVGRRHGRARRRVLRRTGPQGSHGLPQSPAAPARGCANARHPCPGRQQPGRGSPARRARRLRWCTGRGSEEMDLGRRPGWVTGPSMFGPGGAQPCGSSSIFRSTPTAGAMVRKASSFCSTPTV